MGGKERVRAGERVQRGVPEDVCRIREDCRVQAEDTVSERLMDSKSTGPCPQGFESPRCRLQGWREATENSWRLVGGCEALLAPEEVAAQETVFKWLVCVLSGKKMWVTRAIPTELLSNTKKLWSPEKTTPPAGLEGLEPTIFGLEVRRLVH